MAIRPGLNNFLWMTAGAVILLAVIAVVFHFHKERDPALGARKAEIAARMRLDLTSATEAEKCAVMATTDQDSQMFADQARAHTAAVERGREELGGLLKTSETKAEEDVLARFSDAFTEFQRIDKELLQLAVQNTNLKAYALAYGPAAEALNEMDAALARVAANANSTSAEAAQVIHLAGNCRVAALRIQTLLPPHIAEDTDQKMSELEALMAREDQEVRKDLESLGALLKSKGSADIETAASRYARFSELRAEILKLSRENTNVRSLVVSLNRKRAVTLMCQEALAELEQAIRQQPAADAVNRPIAYPR